MNTLDYSLMVLDATNRRQIRKKQKVKSILSIASLFIAIAMMIFNASSIMSGATIRYDYKYTIITVVFLLLFLLCEGYALYFHLVLKRIRKAQSFDLDDPIESATFELNEKFGKYFFRLMRLSLIIIGISLSLILIGLILLFADVIDAGVYAGIFSAAFLLSCITIPFLMVIMQMRFATSAIVQTRILLPYFNQIDGIKSKHGGMQENIFLNMTAAQKALLYQFPDEELRKKNTQAVFKMLLPMLVCGILLGLSISNVFNPLSTLLLTILTVVLLWATIIYVTIYQLSLKKQQRVLLEKDPIKNELLLKHSDETKKYSDRVNKVGLIVGAVILVISWVLIILSYINEPPSEDKLIAIAQLIGGLGFGGLFAWAFLILPYIIIETIFYRKRIRPLEQLIDESQLKQEQLKQEQPTSTSDPFIHETSDPFV